MLFGQYLLKKGKITESELEKTVEYQKKSISFLVKLL